MWSWLSFAAGFAAGIITIIGWAICASAQKADKKAEQLSKEQRALTPLEEERLQAFFRGKIN